MFDNLHFEHPVWLYLIPFLFLLLFLRRRKGANGAISYPTIKFIASMVRNPNSLAGRIGAIMMISAMISLSIALSRPQIVNERTHKSVNGVDLMIAFDLSGSMTTMDMMLQGKRCNRLIAAKYVICHFIDKRPDDRIGIIGFAGRTKSFCPLTLDHDLTTSIIQKMTPDAISSDGTAIGSAIAAAATRLNSRKKTKSKVIILITDGVSNSGQLSPLEAASAAAKLGIRIYTIAVGTEEGQLGRGFQRGEDNFDEPTLKKIAATTGGEHFRATDTNKLLLAFSSIDELEKNEAKLYTIRKVREIFMYFLIAAGIFSALGMSCYVLKPTPAP